MTSGPDDGSHQEFTSGFSCFDKCLLQSMPCFHDGKVHESWFAFEEVHKHTCAARIASVHVLPHSVVQLWGFCYPPPPQSMQIFHFLELSVRKEKGT